MSFFLHALTRQGTACKSSRGGRYSLLPSQTSEAVRASTAEGPVSRCRGGEKGPARGVRQGQCGEQVASVCQWQIGRASCRERVSSPV